MSAPLSRLAYGDAFACFDAAMAEERGYQRYFTSKGGAMNFRTKLHQARTMERKQSRQIYSPGDPLYNQSEYACLIVREPYWDEEKQRWVLRIEKASLEGMEGEPIPAEITPEPPPTTEELFAAVGLGEVEEIECTEDDLPGGMGNPIRG